MTQPDDELLTLEERLEEHLDPDIRDIEAPIADAAEQAMPADPLDVPRVPHPLAFEADEYDALEQERVVELDDDYR
jgi:hypothetical protein